MDERPRLLVVVVLVAVLGACGLADDAGADRLRLDGSARHPDDEGIVTAVDHESVTLDGGRSYDVDRDLAVFSAIDLSTVPLLFTEGQYVQLGADGDDVAWIGTIARPLMTEPPSVLFEGELASVEGGLLVFANGTVLRAGEGVDAGALAGHVVRATIDPASDEVTEVSR